MRNVSVRMFDNMKRSMIVAVIAAAASQMGSAAPLRHVRWNDEAADIAKIEQVAGDDSIRTLRGNGAVVEAIARAFAGTPYVAGTLESDGPEELSINTSGLDCTTFVELVAAIDASVADEGRSWRDVADNLSKMRYRGGMPDGYDSRLHYISDWIINNVFRGMITEVTADAPGARKMVKTLDFMTSHRDLYPALADSAAYAGMLDAERGLRGIQYYYIPKNLLDAADVKAFLRAGDIIFITTNAKGLDVAHAGILVKDGNGEPHLLHASSAAGRVIEDPLTLHRYLMRNKKFDGIRVVRLTP